MTTVAGILADQLAEAGVDKVFGLPGGEIVEILDEVRKRKIEFVLVRNESSAAFMADAYARVTGSPAVCMTTLGPGAANAVMGVAHCYLDRSPVVLLTAQKPQSLLDSYTHQVIDLHAIFRPITKATLRVHAGNARGVIHDALTLAAAGRPGPVHLQLSADDATAAEEESDSSHDRLPQTQQPSALREDQIEHARALLRDAKRPLIVAGLGLEPQRPYESLRTLAETLHAPVVTTPKAKGALADDHPLLAGAIGLTQTDPVYALLNEADCVLAVGFDVVELVKPWEFNSATIWIAPWDNEDPEMAADAELVGDIEEALVALVQDGASVDPDWGESRVMTFRSQPPPSLPAPAPGAITPQAALSVLRERAARDAYLSVDVGSHKIYSALQWPTYVPNHFLLSNGLSSMSFALPAAIGVAEADPTSISLCLTGDAGLAMNAGELGVLAERRLPVVVVVFNDGAIDLIRSHQRRAGKPTFGTEFASPRHDQIAAAFGLPSWRVGDETAFAQALDESLNSRGPALIEVMLDPTGYPTTPRKSA